MTEGAPSPTRIAVFPNGEIGIVWQDGHESYYPGHELRCACACASCIDEVTGAKLLRTGDVPADVQALEIHPVGNYAISVRWSDGHATGIYAYGKLREACPCCR